MAVFGVIRRAVAAVVATGLMFGVLALRGAGASSPPPNSLQLSIAEVALGEVGVAESPLGSNRVPGKSYGTGSGWCGAFVSWVLREVGIDPSARGRGSFGHNIARAWSVEGRRNGYGRPGSAHDARVGDLLIERYTGGSGPGGHVSIVVETNVDGNQDRVRTVGGNESNRVRNQVKDLDRGNTFLVTLAEVLTYEEPGAELIDFARSRDN